MPNLVGIGNSQVPTNGMLGDLAYLDSVESDKLSKIKNEAADTAQGLFVYDTRKDSDGGAWRKRTSHTSWYNEVLGSPTRGTRAEFPAVAICVISDKECSTKLALLLSLRSILDVILKLMICSLTSRWRSRAAGALL